MLTWPDPKQQREASLSLISAACNRLTAATEEVRFLVGPAGDPVLFDQGPTVRTSLKKPWLVNDLSVKPSYRKKFLGPCGLIAMVYPCGTPGPCIWSIRAIQRSIHLLPVVRKCNVQASFT
jgi:hypothetical protein